MNEMEAKNSENSDDDESHDPNKNDEDEDLSNWLEDKDDDENQVLPIPKKIENEIIYPDSQYIQSNKRIYDGLLAVDDLGFKLLPVTRQEEFMKTLVVEEFKPSEIIFQEKSTGTEMYFVLGDIIGKGEVEVYHNLDGNEKVMTRLGKGQYFGQKSFVTQRSVSLND